MESHWTSTKANGAVMTLRGGVIRPEIGWFVTLRSDIPLFKAEDEFSERTRFAMSVTAETGFRFGG